MSKALAALIENHQLEELDKNLFRGLALPYTTDDRIYGGQVLAQAMNAAQRTLSHRFVAHSMHSYFLRPGDPQAPIIFDVDRIRDGRAFSTRRVVALQNGAAILNISLSFQIVEGGFEHQVEMPKVSGPEALPDDSLRYADILKDQNMANRPWPIEYRQVDPLPPAQPPVSEPRAHVWLKAAGELADDLAQHQELLAFASDNPVRTTALRPHGISYWDRSVMVASLDHVMWFHRPFRIDEWLLMELHSSNAVGGRALTRGNVFNRAGDLVASVTQEDLIRVEAGEA